MKHVARSVIVLSVMAFAIVAVLAGIYVITNPTLDESLVLTQDTPTLEPSGGAGPVLTQDTPTLEPSGGAGPVLTKDTPTLEPSGGAGSVLTQDTPTLEPSGGAGPVLTQDTPTLEPSGGAGLPGTLQDRIWNAAAREMGVDNPLTITMVAGSLEQVIWADTCLQLPTINEYCGEQSVPGWRVWLDVGGKLVEVRADKNGTQIRINRNNLHS